VGRPRTRGNAPRPMDLTPTGFGVVAPFACSAAQTAPAAATYAGHHAPAVTPQKSRNSSADVAA
jgi:hypothetical protein